MLEETKKIYEDCADLNVPNWRKINKNELIREAAKLKNGPLKDGYISAIMLNYWTKIHKYHYKCNLVTSPEDIHAWVVTAVMYAIDRKPWEDDTSSIYNDENGPDKVINRIIESKRLTFYQQLNRYNRKINSNTMSLDTLTEEYKDVFIPMVNDNYDFEVELLVKEYFNKKDYFMSFMIDAIIHEDVLDGSLNKKRLASHFRHLDEVFVKRFSEMYEISLEKVQNALQYVNNISTYKFNNKVEYCLIVLEKYFKS
jgi:hypothetical protein